MSMGLEDLQITQFLGPKDLMSKLTKDFETRHNTNVLAYQKKFYRTKLRDSQKMS